MYSLLLALIYLGFVSLGLPDSLLGAGWPVMHGFFQVPVPYMGFISMIVSGCTIASSLISHKVTRKFGTEIVTVFSVFLSAIALLGFSFATKFWMLVILAFPYGLAAGAIDAALNNYVALHYASKHMSWLHCFWGVGTIVSPFVMSYALSTSVWNNGYRIVSCIQVVIGLLFLFTLFLWKENKNEVAEKMQEKHVGIIGALKIKGVPYMLIGFFAYCSAEATTMGWASTYFFNVKGIDGETAAAYASLVFIGLTAGRFFGGFLMDKLGDRKMLRLGTAITLCGIFCLWIPVGNEIFAVIAFVIIGLGYAPIYPCIIHATPSNFGAENAGAIIGIQIASAYVGCTFMSPLYGLLGRYLGYRMMPIYLFVFIVLMICMTEKTFHVTQKCINSNKE